MTGWCDGHKQFTNGGVSNREFRGIFLCTKDHTSSGSYSHHRNCRPHLGEHKTPVRNSTSYSHRGIRKVAFISNGACTARYTSGVDSFQSWLDWGCGDCFVLGRACYWVYLQHLE